MLDGGNRTAQRVADDRAQARIDHIGIMGQDLPLAPIVEMGTQEDDAAIGLARMQGDGDRLARMDPDPFKGYPVIQSRLETRFHVRIPQAVRQQGETQPKSDRPVFLI